MLERSVWKSSSVRICADPPVSPTVSCPPNLYVFSVATVLKELPAIANGACMPDVVAPVLTGTVL